MTAKQMYEQYLELNKISEDMMAPNEKQERKKTFYGALASVFIFMGDIAEMTDEKAEFELIKLEQEVKQYWKEVLEEHAAKNSKTK